MTEAAHAPAPAAAKKGGSKLPLIIVAVVVVIALGAGGWFWHSRSAKAQTADAEQTEAPKKTEVKSVMHLESFVVNLQGASDNGYLRIGIDLGLAAAPKEDEKEVSPVGRLRDAILTVLGTRTIDDLLTPEGKTKLKQDILKSINDSVPEIQCKEVYFTEFLVQH
jgi:flagellar FliL protein